MFGADISPPIAPHGRASGDRRRGGAKPVAIAVILGLVAVGGVAALWMNGRFGSRPASPKVVLIGIDGGDWRVIHPLIDAGRMPHLARLVSEGASGNLASYGLTMSPQVWNTMVTGKHFSQHGVDWFAVRMDAPGQKADLEGKTPLVPITSASRKVPALWDILSQAGDSVGVIGYWATWPATKVNGYMVSDRFSYSRYNKLGGADEYLDHQTYPPELAEELRRYVLAPGDVTDANRARFMVGNVRAADWRVSHDIVGEFDITYAQAQTYRGAGLHLLDRGQPDFFAIYFQGVDVTSHYFWEFMRPEHAGRQVPAESVEKFGGVIEAFYEYQDEIIGEILERIDDDTVVMVVSDHGFRDLPYPQRKIEHISGWHRINGIIALWGNGVRAGITLTGATVYDVAPTILSLKKLPVAKDMPGRVITEAFQEGTLTEPTYVKSYTHMPEVPSVQDLQTPMDEAMLERLRSIGYIGAESDP